MIFGPKTLFFTFFCQKINFLRLAHTNGGQIRVFQYQKRGYMQFFDVFSGDRTLRPKRAAVTRELEYERPKYRHVCRGNYAYSHGLCPIATATKSHARVDEEPVPSSNKEERCWSQTVKPYRWSKQVSLLKRKPEK